MDDSGTVVVFAFGQVVVAVLLVPMTIALMSIDLFALSPQLAPAARRAVVGVTLGAYALAVVLAGAFEQARGHDGVATAVFSALFLSFLWVVRWLFRRYVWTPWLSGDRSHRAAAAATSVAGPGVVALGLAALPSVDLAMRLVLVAAGLAALLLSYGFGLFIFRSLNGARDVART